MSKKVKNRKGASKEITKKDLENTYFVPIKLMRESIEKLHEKVNSTIVCCDYNLLSLKRERSTRMCYDETVERYSSSRHTSLFVSACYKDLYAHDWDRLLFILKRIPQWRFKNMYTFHARIFTILLMYHPESQTNGYLNEYLHMVWGCRQDPDKKAILKTLLTLNKQMYRTVFAKKNC